MKRRVKKESIVILILSIMVITLSIFLMVLANKKGSKDCTCDNKQKISEITTIECGDDNDLARLICNRYRENGYVITYKEDNDENRNHEVMSKLTQSFNSPIIYMNKSEINSILRNVYGLNEEKDFGINALLFVPDYNVDYNKLNNLVSNINELDKVIEFKYQKEK